MGLFALAPALIGAGSSGLDTASKLWAADRAEDANFKAMREQNAFTSDMSSTAYRRAVVDMRAAGLNPALAITQGGASTPSGSSASGGVQPDLDRSASSAFDNMIKQATVDNVKADTTSKIADAKLKDESAKTQKTQQKLNNDLAFKAFLDAGYSLAAAKNLSQLYPGLKNAADVERTFMGKAGAWIDRATKTVGGASSAFVPFKSNAKNYNYYDYSRKFQ